MHFSGASDICNSKYDNLKREMIYQKPVDIAAGIFLKKKSSYHESLFAIQYNEWEQNSLVFMKQKSNNLCKCINA